MSLISVTFSRTSFDSSRRLRTAIDNREGKRSTVPEDHHRGHCSEPVYLAGDLGQSGAGINLAPQLHGEKEVGLIQLRLDAAAPGINRGRIVQRNLFVRQLKQEVDRFPFTQLRPFSRFIRLDMSKIATNSSAVFGSRAIVLSLR